jgi:hypothetical protein
VQKLILVPANIQIVDAVLSARHNESVQVNADLVNWSTVTRKVGYVLPGVEIRVIAWHILAGT